MRFRRGDGCASPPAAAARRVAGAPRSCCTARSSMRTTVSASAGTGEPVEIRAAVFGEQPRRGPAECTLPHRCLIRRFASSSPSRTANPSIAEASNGGLSRSATTGSASTRPAARSSDTVLHAHRRHARPAAAPAPPAAIQAPSRPPPSISTPPIGNARSLSFPPPRPHPRPPQTPAPSTAARPASSHR